MATTRKGAADSARDVVRNQRKIVGIFGLLSTSKHKRGGVIAANAIGRFGSHAKELLPDILNLFYEVVLDHKLIRGELFALGCYSLTPDPSPLVLAHFSDASDPRVSRMLGYLGKYEPLEEEEPEENVRKFDNVTNGVDALCWLA